MASTLTQLQRTACEQDDHVCKIGTAHEHLGDWGGQEATCQKRKTQRNLVVHMKFLIRFIWINID
jgi:hypothetical protein